MSDSHTEFTGNHILGELYGISRQILDCVETMESAILTSISAGNATVCGYMSYKFEPSGVTTVVLLSESHASLHTYPESGCLFFDVFTCGKENPEVILDALCDYLKPSRKTIKIIPRGL